MPACHVNSFCASPILFHSPLPTETGRCMSRVLLGGVSSSSDATDDAFSSAFYINLDRRVDRRAVHALLNPYCSWYTYWLVPFGNILWYPPCMLAVVAVLISSVCVCVCVCVSVCVCVCACVRTCSLAWGFVLTDSTWSLSCGAWHPCNTAFGMYPRHSRSGSLACCGVS